MKWFYDISTCQSSDDVDQSLNALNEVFGNAASQESTKADENGEICCLSDSDSKSVILSSFYFIMLQESNPLIFY